jgi:hypothetical protein
LLDLMLGAWIVSMGVMHGTDLDFVPALFVALGVPLWLAGKRWFTIPRIGLVRFGAERQQAIHRSYRWLLAILLLTFFGGVLAYFTLAGEATHFPVRLLFGFVVASLIALVGFLFDIRRLNLYAAAVFLAYAAGETLRNSQDVIVVFTGVAVVLCGAVILGRFLRKYPRQEQAGS